MTSSWCAATPCISEMMGLIAFWKDSGDTRRPKSKRLCWNNPKDVLIFVIERDGSSDGTYNKRRSKYVFERNSEPEIWLRMPSGSRLTHVDFLGTWFKVIGWSSQILGIFPCFFSRVTIGVIKVDRYTLKTKAFNTFCTGCRRPEKVTRRFIKSGEPDTFRPSGVILTWLWRLLSIQQLNREVATSENRTKWAWEIHSVHSI